MPGWALGGSELTQLTPVLCGSIRFWPNDTQQCSKQESSDVRAMSGRLKH